jgi:hypothetical protein
VAAEAAIDEFRMSSLSLMLAPEIPNAATRD